MAYVSLKSTGLTFDSLEKHVKNLLVNLSQFDRLDERHYCKKLTSVA
jgi:hypothetical protein